MAEAIVLVQINSADLYKTGHMAHRWAGTVSRRLSTNVRASAPRRTGAMKAGIHGGMKAVPQARTLDITLSSLAPYTLAVLRGTGGRSRIITSTEYPLKKMGPLPPWAGKRSKQSKGKHGGEMFPRAYYLAVYGQTRNNFLQKGWSKTMLKHSALRPMPMFVKHP